jgi:hypothetical protein
MNRAIKFSMIALLTFTALWQGGYPDLLWLALGAIGALLLAIAGVTPPPKPLAALFAAMTIAYAVSSVANGMTDASWLVTVRWLTAFLWLTVFCSVGVQVEDVARVTGSVIAFVGLLAFCGLLPLPGMVSEGRLYGTFQYANAYAIYLVPCAFVLRASPVQSRFTGLMECALFLTQSVGGVGCYALGWLLALVSDKDSRDELRGQLPGAVASALCAGAMIVITRTTPQAYWYCAVLPPIVLCALDGAIRRIPPFKYLLPSVAVLTAVGAAGFVAAVGMRPFATYIERLVQIADGLRVIAAHPFGIGPGRWQFHAQEYQSAFYAATVLHSFPVSVGVSAGVPALALAICGAAYIFAKNTGEKKLRIALAMIMVHAVFDISLSFLSVALLACLLCARVLAPEPRAKQAKFRLARLAPCALCAVYALLIVPQATKLRALRAADGGRLHEAAALLSGDMFRRSPEAETLRLEYLTLCEEDALTDGAFAALEEPSAYAYRLLAESRARRGDHAGAAAAAVEGIRRSPYLSLGYEQLDKLARALTPDLRLECLAQAGRIREEALAGIHPLAKFRAEFDQYGIYKE